MIRAIKSDNGLGKSGKYAKSKNLQVLFEKQLYILYFWDKLGMFAKPPSIGFVVF